MSLDVNFIFETLFILYSTEQLSKTDNQSGVARRCAEL